MQSLEEGGYGIWIICVFYAKMMWCSGIALAKYGWLASSKSLLDYPATPNVFQKASLGCGQELENALCHGSENLGKESIPIESFN